MSLKKTILGFIGDTFLTSARVASVTKVSEHFRFIEIEAEELKAATWKPGEKVQINVGDWNVRTYTPLSIDRDHGRMKILAFLHGQGPGSRWAANTKAGDACQILGPRSSLALEKTEEPAVLFGDETSFAVAATLARANGAASTRFIFEVENVEETRTVLTTLELTNVALIAKKQDGEHLDQAFQSVRVALEDFKTSRLILTGNAQSIQKIRSRLREQTSYLSQTLTKAYWALGKTGID